MLEKERGTVMRREEKRRESMRGQWHWQFGMDRPFVGSCLIYFPSLLRVAENITPQQCR